MNISNFGFRINDSGTEINVHNIAARQDLESYSLEEIRYYQCLQNEIRNPAAANIRTLLNTWLPDITGSVTTRKFSFNWIKLK